MNQKLALFIQRCEFAGVCDGELIFKTPVGVFWCFDKRYADNLDRSEDSELFLYIYLLQNGSMLLELDCTYCTLDRSKSISIVNQTVEEIERWLLTANTDASKALPERWEEGSLLEPALV